MFGDFRILGPLEIRFGGRLIPLGPPKRRVLALTLLLTAGRPVPLERLVDAIWDDSPPASAVANVRTYAAGLRPILGPRLETADNGYVLHVEPGELDLTEFDTLMDRAKRAAAPAEHLRAALALWRGRAGEGLPVAGAAGRYLRTLDERRLLATEDLAEALLEQGQTDAAGVVAQELLVEFPLRERAWAQLMRARYRAGDVSGALSGFTSARKTLVERLGVEPSRDLVELHRSMLRRDPDLAGPVARVAPAVPGRAVPRQLAPRPAAFVGRDEELAALAKGLADADTSAAVLAIHGMGGTGKSALAMEFAHRVAESFPDGQLYCDLLGGAGAAVDPASVLRRFVAALDARARGGLDAQEALARYRTLLADRRVLIVLDNAVDEAQIRPLLPVVAGSALLITSRRMLAALDGAVHLALSGLPESDAIDLLSGLAGAERIREDRAASTALAELCGWLPLALRIAGARLAARPDWTVGSLLRVLSQDRRRLDELDISDLSVRGCFESSFQGLAGDRGQVARRAFRAFGALNLSAVPAAPVAAIAGLPGAVAESALDDLVSARLLEPAESVRYRAHDLLLLYAAELATPECDLAAGLQWYRSAAAHAVHVFRPRGGEVPAPEGLDLAGERDAVAWLEAERANLITLAQRTADGPDPGFTVQIGRILGKYLPFRGEWGDYLALAGLARQAATDPDDAAWAEFGLGMAFSEAGEVATGVVHLSAALAAYRHIGGLDGQVMTLDRLGIAGIRQQRYKDALRFFDECLELLRRTGDESAEARTRCNAAWALMLDGDHATSQSYLERALAIRRAEGDKLAEGVIRGNLSRIHVVRGRHHEALAEAASALSIAQEVGNRHGEGEALENLRDAHAALGNAEAAGEAARRLSALRALMGAA